MKSYRLHLIRHGITQANTESIYCGSTDLPLSPEGVSDLMRLAGDYSYPFCDVVYTSPLARARQSAHILFPDSEQILVEGLREASFGIYEGKKFTDLTHDADFQRWVTFGSEVVPSGAEPHDVFHRRCVETFISIVTTMMQNGVYTAAIVTHAGVIANILATLAFPRKSPYDWQTMAGCGYTVLADPMTFSRSQAVEVIDYVPPEIADEI